MITSPDAFQILLRYIYGGKLLLEEYGALDIINILIAANELNLRELIPHLQSFLIEKRANWMEQNFNSIYQISFEYDSFLELQNYCANLISKDPVKIFKSTNSPSIPEKVLISILQNDNLQMEEIQVWEFVLKWGLAQNPELPLDIADYSKDDFNALKNTLQQYIPLIKFYNLTAKEFLEKVLPYKKILPKELCKDLLKTFLSFLNPNCKPSDKRTIDSKIITYQHAELISKWIDKLEVKDIIRNSYEFKLILHGSRDGFSGKKFHEICDYHSNTVSVIKVQDSNEILGGYNPIVWKSVIDTKYDIFSSTKDSFIFSFANKENVDDYILSRVKDENKAIINWHEHGPSFGNGDLLNNNIYSICLEVSYEKPIRKTINASDRFYVEEYEVFQIIKF